MANGIFLYSAIKQFPLLYEHGKLFAFILTAVWALIVLSVLSTLVNRTFKKRHLDDPIQLFAIGTWVAGTSVLGNVIYQFSLNLGLIPYMMGILNVVLYLWYIYYCMKAYFVIFQTTAKDQVHGVLLLATVSTQSIVLLLYNIFDQIIPNWGNTIIIYFGIFLYLIGFSLILRRYIVVRNWHIADDWQNTNCILHGAISITGLAASTTGALPYPFTLFLWIWVIVWFMIVEGIELLRAISRINRFGIVKAIGNYNVSQWSRNFTFGMLYAFTASFTIEEGMLLVPLRQIILDYGAWLVLLFLINEILLFFKAKVKWAKKTDHDSKRGHPAWKKSVEV
ncbi:hypothetical protein [Terrihalobacillus insolitus]|nr:hypothetical protein [Terrihalobacillus insolitus]MDC3413516.1 hypothetical protein [Terrihalobacillus insolitus]